MNQRKLKIAIYVSGEIRTYLKQDNMLPHFVNFLKEWGHDVILFGHTWKHSLPNAIPIDFSLFDDFKILDQKYLFEWVLEDQDNRMIAPTVNKTIDRFLGQVWSGIDCFTTFGNKCIEDYDFHIRWRWDLYFDIPQDEFFRQRAEDFFNEIFLSYDNDNHIPSIITSSNASLSCDLVNNQITYSGILEDRFFALNKLAMEKIVFSDTEKLIGSTLKFYKNIKNEGRLKNPHTLWWDLLLRNTKSTVKLRWYPYLIDIVK